jgi:ribose 5-phosphate isomerase B
MSALVYVVSVSVIVEPMFWWRGAGGTVWVMRIAVGTDEQGPTPDAVKAWLREAGHEVVEPAGDVAQWPEVGRLVATAVAQGDADMGVVCCWTGTGVAMAANKVFGVRAALCTDAPTAVGARRWNDANVLAISLRLTTTALAQELCEAFTTAIVDDAERPVIGRIEPEAN